MTENQNYCLNINPSNEDKEILKEYINLKHEYERKSKLKLKYQKYIKSLNKYNNIKDIAQELIGIICNIKGISTKDYYEPEGIDLDE